MARGETDRAVSVWASFGCCCKWAAVMCLVVVLVVGVVVLVAVAGVE